MFSTQENRLLIGCGVFTLLMYVCVCVCVYDFTNTAMRFKIYTLCVFFTRAEKDSTQTVVKHTLAMIARQSSTCISTKPCVFKTPPLLLACSAQMYVNSKSISLSFHKRPQYFTKNGHAALSLSPKMIGRLRQTT